MNYSLFDLLLVSAIKLAMVHCCYKGQGTSLSKRPSVEERSTAVAVTVPTVFNDSFKKSVSALRPMMHSNRIDREDKKINFIMDQYEFGCNISPKH